VGLAFGGAGTDGVQLIRSAMYWGTHGFKKFCGRRQTQTQRGAAEHGRPGADGVDVVAVGSRVRIVDQPLPATLVRGFSK